MHHVLHTKRSLLFAGALLILLGGFLAHCIQTTGGIRVLDVRFAGTGATLMSGLLYVPPNATPKTPAPAILAIHGYFNSREAQDGFAIEFARRGYVVLAIDQTGHGYSAPPAFANAFGGPDGLKYLRSLDVVDKDNIGLEGHSMGGWAVMNAAAALPNGYRAVVLEGSSTGAPFAPEGTPTFPRNLAVVFSEFDEFPQIMWGVPDAREIVSSPKLNTLFGSGRHAEPGRIYGSIAEGSARILYMPNGTHPMDHLSTAAIGYSLEWFQRTLHGGTRKPPGDQIWYWKEIGTLTALIGFILLLLGTVDFLLRTPYFAPLTQVPDATTRTRDRHSWATLLTGSVISAITLLPFFELGHRVLPPTHLFPQAFTNEIAVWAILNALVVAALAWRPNADTTPFNTQGSRSILIAILTVGIGYLALVAADFLFKVDFRIWFMALKLMSPAQVRAFLMYLPLFTLYFVVVLRVLHNRPFARSDRRAVEYLANIAALAGGLLVFVIFQYGWLFTNHHLLSFFMNDPLRTIISIGFVPLLSSVAIVSTFVFRRTNSYLPGALICALVVTWYVVAGQATHAT
ncbi:MAG: alpha/beta hydrolase family protein [Steroidobacteraceae bacterium]